MIDSCDIFAGGEPVGRKNIFQQVVFRDKDAVLLLGSHAEKKGRCDLFEHRNFLKLFLHGLVGAIGSGRNPSGREPRTKAEAAVRAQTSRIAPGKEEGSGVLEHGEVTSHSKEERMSPQPEERDVRPRRQATTGGETAARSAGRARSNRLEEKSRPMSSRTMLERSR